MVRSAPVPDRPPRVLLVMPTMWDRRQVEAASPAWSRRFEVELGRPGDEDCPQDLDVLEFVRSSAARADLAGVLSSSDYPGATLAAAIASAAGLPGPTAVQALRASHKLASREMQLRSVPEATARHCRVDPSAPRLEEGLDFPCFVKPVKGAFSMFARRVDSQAELEEALDRPAVHEFRTGYLGIFNRMWAHYVGEPIDGRYFIAEELLSGSQVTVEGFVAAGESVIVGIVDSELHPGTGSFSRFVYPSLLPAQVQERMADIARRCIAGLGLRRTFFNIEMVFDPRRDRVSIIEVNPRICGQFADLYEKVDGTNTYATAVALATGQEVRWRPRQGSFAWAASVPLRLFEPSRALAVPDPERIARIEEKRPGTRIWNEIIPGPEFDDFGHEDGISLRYGVVNLGAESRADLEDAAREIVAELGYAFTPLTP